MGEGLPILKYRKEFVELCRSPNHAVVLVSAATGSGKTTQLPQFLLNDLNARMICVTQPRRVAAITLAKRVSFERREPKFGQGEIGYRVRFQNATCKRTRLVFSTDGLLLREAMHDPTLSHYDFIVLDEVHERSLNTDLLFGVVKRALAIRNAGGKIQLRVVVMSATVDIDLFQAYFSASVLQCEGRQHPVDVFYLQQASLDRVQDSIQAVLQVHEEEKEMGGILLFLSGKEEIEGVCRALEQSKVPNLLVCALHASLPHELQLRAFERAPPGVRKIVVSTNVAETSVTVDGIQFVIDSGVCKVKRNLSGCMKKLSVTAISKSSAVQRAGRAGRELPGKCFRLYQESTYEKMPQNLLPEIQRVDLAEVVMQLLALGVTNLASFDFLQRPEKAQLKQAIATLSQLHAISTTNANGETGLTLTERGRQMSNFPVEPLYAALLLSASANNCVRSICGMVAMECGVELPFYGASKDAQQAKKKWISPKGDHFTALHLLDAFESCGTSTQKFCRENYVRAEVLHQAKQAREELVKLCNKFAKQQEGEVAPPVIVAGGKEDEDQVLKCLVRGTVSRIAKKVERSEYELLSTGERVFIHPSCSLSLLNMRPDYVVFDEILVTSKTYLRGVSAVSEDVLAGNRDTSAAAAGNNGGVVAMTAAAEAAAKAAQLEKSKKRRERSWAID